MSFGQECLNLIIVLFGAFLEGSDEVFIVVKLLLQFYHLAVHAYLALLLLLDAFLQSKYFLRIGSYL